MIDSLEGLKAYDAIDALFSLEINNRWQIGLYQFIENFVFIHDHD